MIYLSSWCPFHNPYKTYGVGKVSLDALSAAGLRVTQANYFSARRLCEVSGSDPVDEDYAALVLLVAATLPLTRPVVDRVQLQVRWTRSSGFVEKRYIDVMETPEYMPESLYEVAVLYGTDFGETKHYATDCRVYEIIQYRFCMCAPYSGEAAVCRYLREHLSDINEIHVGNVPTRISKFVV